MKYRIGVDVSLSHGGNCKHRAFFEVMDDEGIPIRSKTTPFLGPIWSNEVIHDEYPCHQATLKVLKELVKNITENKMTEELKAAIGDVGSGRVR